MTFEVILSSVYLEEKQEVMLERQVRAGITQFNEQVPTMCQALP